jgi:6-phosphogluconolactonase
MKYITFVGSYTDALHPEGIHVLESDAETGDFRVVNVVNTYAQTTYMALNRAGTRLYSVLNRSCPGPAGRTGGLVSFAVNGANLTPLNEIGTGWTAPCHVALSPDERTLVYAEYSCGTAGYAELTPDGAIDPAFSGLPGVVNPRFQVRHAGDGPNKPRQDAAHAHCSIVTPDGKYLLVVDLTLDEVKAYDFAHREHGLKEVPSASIRTQPRGAGPRHIVFHPSGKYAFVVFELENRVASYRYTGEGFEHLDTQALLDPAFTEFSKAAAVKVSEDGTQVFCSNRGHDSITVFNFDAQTGRLHRLSNARLDGRFPRDFTFMPGGKFCLAGLKESGRLASYAYDRETGRFTLAAKMEAIFRPLFITFKTA